MNRDGIRIEKIKSDHIELLKKARNDILENREKVAESINDVISIIDFDEKSVKKQKAAHQAQELIATLTKEIVEAKTKEDVIEIRKKLNYYMNKIKAEIKSRELDEKYLTDYQAKITYLRKDIAKYIRFLKREDNIAEIDKLYSNYENLSKEEMVTLKKALKKEVNYNRRNLAEPKEIIEDFDIVEDINPQSESEMYMEETIEEYSEKENDFVFVPTEEMFEEVDYQYEEPKKAPRRPGFQLSSTGIKAVEFSDVEDYLSSAVKNYNGIYNIKQTIDYGRKGLGKNMANFFRNIPNYIHNKKAVKKMERDYCRYYAGSDLRSYIEYVKRRNSISQGLKCIFSRTQLYSNNNLVEHDKCTIWLYEFCKKHGMSISYQKVKSM